MMKEKTKKQSSAVWIILFVIASMLLMGAIVVFYLNTSKMNLYGSSLDDIYNRSVYELVDSVNNTEVKMSKLLTSNDGVYQRKLIDELMENTVSAQNNISTLPLSLSSLSSTTKFVNQMYGYLSSIQKDLNADTSLSLEQKEKLRELHVSVKKAKDNLAVFSKKIEEGYSILNESNMQSGDYNNFSNEMMKVKGSDTDYPSMIYDGPFADSMLSPEIKGLNYDEVDKEDAKKTLETLYDNITELSFSTETNGRIKTYDYTFKLGETNVYAQMTKQGGKLLTLSAVGDGNDRVKSLEEAERISKEFCEKSGIENVQVVWSDVIGCDAYVNLAPVKNDAILYPDLVKIKVDLQSGLVIGFSATSFYTNHTERQIDDATYAPTEAKARIEEDFNNIVQKLCIAPLEYGEEILCWEFRCEQGGTIFYIYINAQTGAEENILKVIETDNGRLLM